MKVDLRDPAVQQLYQAYLALVRGYHHTGRVDDGEAGDFLISLREFAAGQDNGREMQLWADEALRTLHVPGTITAVLHWSPDVDMRYRPMLFTKLDRDRPRMMFPDATYLERGGYFHYAYGQADLVIYLYNGRQKMVPLRAGDSAGDFWPQVLEDALKEASLCTLRDAVMDLRPEMWISRYTFLYSSAYGILELCDDADEEPRESSPSPSLPSRSR